jgi:hypothetical protein
MGGRKENPTGHSRRHLLSIPSNPEAVIKPRADLPKLSRNAALAATAAKFWLAFAPPIDNMTFR